MSKRFNNVLLGTDKKRVFLEDCTVTYTEKIKNKELEYLEEKDQISIVSDALFKTMLCNRENKMFICKILAELLERPFDEIMVNSEYYKNELDKDTVHTKGQRADLILKLDDDYIQVEMNNTDAIYRDIEYADKLYRAKILIGKKYIYPRVLSISLNNLYYKEFTKDYIQIFHIQTDDHISLEKKIYVRIYLPILLKKWYDEGVEKLSGLEKTLITMSMTDNEKAKEVARGDEILEKYVENVKRVEKTDDIFREAYECEFGYAAGEREAGIEIGFEKGHEQGLEEGLEKGKIEERIKVIKSMHESGLSLDSIAKICNCSKEEINKIINNKD